MQEQELTVLRQHAVKDWCRLHGRPPPPPDLPETQHDAVREWFDLVDDDGSGSLDRSELTAAFQVRLPSQAGNTFLRGRCVGPHLCRATCPCLINMHRLLTTCQVRAMVRVHVTCRWLDTCVAHACRRLAYPAALTASTR